jgi:hypothetical protein
MRYFCTYFDRRFLPRALALFESLRQWCPEFRLWALCMDEASHAALRELALPGVEPISLAEFERNDPQLRRAKASRSPVEYYFTCTPSLPLYVLRQVPEVDLITYLDADLYFFADPRPLFEELGEASVGIIPHRFSRRVADHEKYGIYNVGWLSFRRDESGLACLRWWREQCLEWCYARLEEGRYADQKYLDRWPELFPNVRVLRHKGANLGPWNLANYKVTVHDGRPWVDEQPLLFYHFSSFLRVAPWLYNTNLASWHVRPQPVVRRRIIGAYIAALEALPSLPDAGPARAADPRPAEGTAARIGRKLRAVSRILGGLVAQDHLVVLRRQVL